MIDAHHGDLDEVGGGALDGRVDGVALGGGPQNAILRIDVADVATTAHERLHVLVLAGEIQCIVQIIRDFRETAEVVGDELLGLGLRNLQAVGETEGGDAVQNPEVDGLGGAAHVGGNLLFVNAVDMGGHRRVDILVVAEGFDHALVLAHVRDDAELDLRVVGGEQHVAIGGHERLADVAAALGTHGDVL